MKTASNSISAKWRIAKIEDVSDLIMGQAPKGDTYNDKGTGLPLIAGASDLGYLYPAPKRHTDAPAKRCRCGDIILCVRATIGDLNWSDREYCLGRGVAALRAKPSVDSTFLYYWIQTNKSALLDLGRGATFKQISKVDISTFPVPVPPIEEQRRIVGRIKELMERVDEIRTLREEALKEAEAVFLSVLHSRFEALSAEASLASLYSVADVRGGQSLPEGVVVDPGLGAAMLIKVGDMNTEGNEVEMTSSRAYTTDKTLIRKSIPVGSVVLPKRGGAIATNKKRLLGRPALLDPNLMAVVADPSRMRAEYLLYWFMNFDLRTITSGSTVPQLNKQDLDPLKIPVPSLEVQDQVVASLKAARTSADMLVGEKRAASEGVKALPQSILRKAFAGEL